MYYEIHLTVDLKHNIDFNKFIATCNLLKVKPIILDLITQKNIIKDAMTSSKFFANNPDELNKEVKRISDGLLTNGFLVIRTKIEVQATEEYIPSEKQYFESHINIITTIDKEVELRNLANKLDLHISKNMKKIIGDSLVIMGTYRTNNIFKEFNENLNIIRSTLISNNYILEKNIMEFVIFDSLKSHDNMWTNKIIS